MQLSVIIINYKSAGLVANCLRTLYAETSRISFEVIIVDNNSGDDSEALLKASFPHVRWIQMTYNAGFARANNEGIRQSVAEVVLLLNGDTLIQTNAVENVYQNFTSSAYVACGVQLLNADGTPQISGNYAVKGGLNYLLPLPFLGDAVKGIGNLLHVSKPNIPDSNDVVEVDWINGAFLMVKKSAIATAGLLDEDFFLYAEEAEWCSRLQKTGKLCIFGQYKVVHLQGETTGVAFQSEGKGYYNVYDKKGLQIMLSNLVRIRKQFGVSWFLVIVFFYFMEIPILYVVVLLQLLTGKRNFSFRDANGFAKNVFFLLKIAPTIVRNKPHLYKVL